MFNLKSADLTALFAAEFELCKLRTSEVAVILAEPDSRPDYVAAAFAAATLAGAKVVQVSLPSGSPVALPSTHTGTGYGLRAVEENQPVLELLKAVDFVVDTTLEGNIHTPLLNTILQADTRVLFVCDPPEILERNLSSASDKAYLKDSADRIARSKTLTVTSEAGTNLTADLTDAHPGYQCGFADEPGRWDHWPSRMVLCWPHSDGVNGQLVLDEGDIVFPFKQYVTHPVRFTVEHGRIVEVKGGAEATLIKKFFQQSGDSAARMLSHMGWGCMDTADWLALSMYDKESLMGMDGRAAAGNFLTSTGPHPFENRWTPYHLDFPMDNCTVQLDGVSVTENGVLVR